jgi:hypothetical protein
MWCVPRDDCRQLHLSIQYGIDMMPGREVESWKLLQAWEIEVEEK